MTKKKKLITIVTLSILIIGSSAFGVAVMSGACGFESFHGQRFHKRGMPPFLQKEIKEFILWRMDKEFGTIDMSAPQQDRYDAFRSRVAETLEKGMETRLEFKKQALLELEKENPDLSAMAVNIQSHLEMMSSSLSENVTLFVQFYDTLDADQKQKITGMVKEKVNRHKEYGECYGEEI